MGFLEKTRIANQPSLLVVVPPPTKETSCRYCRPRNLSLSPPFHRRDGSSSYRSRQKNLLQNCSCAASMGKKALRRTRVRTAATAKTRWVDWELGLDFLVLCSRRQGKNAQLSFF